MSFLIDEHGQYHSPVQEQVMKLLVLGRDDPLVEEHWVLLNDDLQSPHKSLSHPKVNHEVE